MLEPKDYQKYIDESIDPGDYIVRELGGQYYVGQVIELSPNFYRYKVINAFPLGEGVVRHEEAIKCYPAPLRKFKEGDVVICREHIGKWTVMEDEKDSVLVGIKDKCTGTIKAVTPCLPPSHQTNRPASSIQIYQRGSLGLQEEPARTHRPLMGGNHWNGTPLQSSE